MTRADWVLLVLVLAALPWLYARLWFGTGEARQLSVIADGQPQRIEWLHRDQDVRVQGVLGESVIRIENGRARFLASPCSNKVCLHQGWLNHAGAVAACLPNRVSIQVLNGDTRYDAINF